MFSILALQANLAAKIFGIFFLESEILVLILLALILLILFKKNRCIGLFFLTGIKKLN